MSQYRSNLSKFFLIILLWSCLILSQSSAERDHFITVVFLLCVLDEQQTKHVCKSKHQSSYLVRLFWSIWVS